MEFQCRVLWIFPAWIATYIAMSAPLGGILDRHIKIVRFSRHPLVLSGETIPEPLLHMLDDAKGSPHHPVRRSQRRRDRGKQGASKNIDQRRSGNKHVAPPEKAQSARFAIPDMISRTPKDSLDATCVEASGDDHFAQGDNQGPPGSGTSTLVAKIADSEDGNQ